MNLNKFIQVGILRKPHGIKGEINFQLYYSLKNPLKQVKAFFLKIGGKPVPYFVNNINSISPFSCVIAFDEIVDRSQANGLSSSPVYVTTNEFNNCFEKKKEFPLYDQVIGYMIKNESEESIGIIQDVIKLPQQFLAQLQYKNQEILIPLNENTIIRLNPEKKDITIKIAEGLLDL